MTRAVISIPGLWVPRPKVFKIPLGEWLALYRPPLEWFTGRPRRTNASGKILTDRGVAILSNSTYNACDCLCFAPVPRDCTGQSCDWCGGNPTNNTGGPSDRQYSRPDDYEAVFNDVSIPAHACVNFGPGTGAAHIFTGGSPDGTYCMGSLNGICRVGTNIRTMASGSVGTVWIGTSDICTTATGATINKISFIFEPLTTGYTMNVNLTDSANALVGVIFRKTETVGPEAKVQVDTFTVGGTVEIGDIFTIKFVRPDTGAEITINHTATTTSVNTTASGLSSAFATATSVIAVNKVPTVSYGGAATFTVQAKHAGIAHTYNLVTTTESGGGASDGQTLTKTNTNPNGANTKNCYETREFTNALTAADLNYGGATIPTRVVGHSGTLTMFACCTPL